MGLLMATTGAWGEAGLDETLTETLPDTLTDTQPAVPTPAESEPDHPNVAFYRSWSMDRDNNGLDDRIDDRLSNARGNEPVFLVLHYARAPTEADIAYLTINFPVTRPYLFQNFDMIQLLAPLSAAPALRDAPGVVAVELFEPPRPELDTSAATIRARQATGIPIIDGYNHTLAVHETLGLRGQGMVIAIVDTGVDTTHESLQGKIVSKPGPAGVPLYGGVNTAQSLPIGCIDPVDNMLHGTHVAGIALGDGGPGDRYRGIAPEARLVDVQISLPGGLGTGMLIGFDWIISFNKGETCYGDPGDDAIDVVNLSYGAGGNNPDNSQARAINRIVQEGMVFVVSAGNSGPGEGSLTKGPDAAVFVANSDDRNTVLRDDHILAIGSSRGPRTDDGDREHLDELRPDVAAPGTSVTSAMLYSQQGYIGLSGTSMAAPHVAGVAALMLQANPDLRPFALAHEHKLGHEGSVPVRDLLQQTAQYKNETNGPEPQMTATGKFDLPWNNAWGYGLIDAYTAVQLAQNSLAVHPGGPYIDATDTNQTLHPMTHVDPAELDFHWQVHTAPAASDLHDWVADEPEPDFTPDVPGDYRLRITVSDSDGREGNASVILTAQ